MLIERVLTLLRDRSTQIPLAAPTDSTLASTGVRVSQVAIALDITPQQAVSALHLLVRKKRVQRLGAHKPYQYVLAPPAEPAAPALPLPIPAAMPRPTVLAPLFGPQVSLPRSR